MADQRKSAKPQLGCIVCRSRKIKCDQTKVQCRNCLRLGVQCPGYDNASGNLSRDDMRSCVEDIYQTSGIKKRRVGSCKECRTSKNRCSRGRPKCRRCTQKSLKCNYPLAINDFQQGSSVQTVDGDNLDDLSELSSSVNNTAWLYKDSLPEEKGRLQIVFDLFFGRIAALRCLGFIHKPSFLQSFDQGSVIDDFGEALVLIISALGASVYVQENIESLKLKDGTIPGSLWATKAQELAMREVSCPSVTTLMTMILISEYATKFDKHALAFITWGCSYQIMRLLGFDSPEKSARPASPADSRREETKRRLLWSCFILDSCIGSGIDANLRWKEEIPAVFLPSSDHSFLEQALVNNPKLATLELFNSPDSLKQMNLRSQLIYLFHARTQVLRLIRTSNPPVAIWHPQSSFLKLIEHLELWYSNIRDELRITSLSIYIGREINTLGSLFMLYFLYHSIVCDLTRTSLPGYEFPLASAFRNAPTVFRQQCQDRCRFHADQIAQLVQMGLAEGKRAFDDSHCIMAAFESIKIQIVHTCTATENGPEERMKASKNITENMKLLHEKHLQKDKPNPYLRRLFPLLSRFGFHEILSEWSDSGISTREKEEIVGPAEVGYLSNAAPFRLAKLDVQGQQRFLEQKSSQAVNNTTTHEELPGLNVEHPPPVTGMYLPGIHFPPGEPVSQFLQSEDNQGFYSGSSESNLAVPEDLLAFSSEDFVRLAEEMSGNITWDASHMPY